MKISRGIVSLFAAIWLFQVATAHATQPIANDPRIKTLVYNENEVYNLTTYYGYQLNVEFAKNEHVEAVSLGDRVGWQIIPSGRRLFIRAMHGDLHTNMTVLTNRRSYQFDLTSRAASERKREDFVYVMRFYYPDITRAPAAGTVTSADLVNAVSARRAPAVNYRYTVSGNEMLTPLQVFDDGQRTFFKMPASLTQAPQVVVMQGERQQPVDVQYTDDYVVVPVTAAQFALRVGSDVAYVFNESMM